MGDEEAEDSVAEEVEVDSEVSGKRDRVTT